MAKVSLYGQVALPKAFCKLCNADSFIVDRKLVCCGNNLKDADVHAVKRECECSVKNIADSTRQRILRLQQFRCYFCGIDFKQDNFYIHKNKPKRIKIEFDHFIPKSFSVIDTINNLYASCSLCNHIKSSKMFETREDAVDFIMERRRKKGWLETYTMEEIGTLKESCGGLK